MAAAPSRQSTLLAQELSTIARELRAEATQSPQSTPLARELSTELAVIRAEAAALTAKIQIYNNQ